MATLLSIAINPDVAIIYLGDSIQYKCLATYDDGSVVDVTELTTWGLTLSPPPTVVEFDTTTEGLLLSREVGVETVYADYEGKSDTGSVTVHNPLIQELPSALVGKYRPVTQDYLDLITSQYQNSPKFLHWIRTYLEIVEDIRELVLALPYYFSFNKIIETPGSLSADLYLTVKAGDFTFVEFEACIGDQLDIIGEIVGQPRKVTFNPTGGASPILDDDTYRLLLKNTIMFNHWNGDQTSMQEFWTTLFPGGKIIIQDNQNMTMDITLLGSFTQMIIDLITHDYIVPRPQGVLCNYNYGTTPFFGHDRRDVYIAGFDEGNWV